MHHLPVPQSWSLWAFQVPEMPLHPRFLLLHPRPCPPLCILALCLGAVMVLYRMSRRTPADILESSGTWFHHLVSLALWSVFHPLAYDICSALCIWWLMLPLYTLKISTSSQLSWYQVPYVTGKRRFLTQPEVQAVPPAQLVNKREIFLFYTRLPIGGLKLKGRKLIKYIFTPLPQTLENIYFLLLENVDWKH